MRKRRQTERTEISDQLMIDTAINIVQRRGISGLRMTDVGLQAGYSRGLAAMRFGTMGGLLRRMARQLGAGWVQHVEEAVAQKTGLEAIYAVIDLQMRLLAPPAYGFRAVYLIFFHSMDPGAAERMNTARVLAAQQRDLARWISEGIVAGEVRRDADPAAEAESILGSLMGIALRSLMDPAVSADQPCIKLKAEIAERLRRRRPALISPSRATKRQR